MPLYPSTLKDSLRTVVYGQQKLFVSLLDGEHTKADFTLLCNMNSIKHRISNKLSTSFFLEFLTVKSKSIFRRGYSYFTIR